MTCRILNPHFIETNRWASEGGTLHAYDVCRKSSLCSSCILQKGWHRHLKYFISVTTWRRWTRCSHVSICDTGGQADSPRDSPLFTPCFKKKTQLFMPRTWRDRLYVSLLLVSLTDGLDGKKGDKCLMLNWSLLDAGRTPSIDVMLFWWGEFFRACCTAQTPQLGCYPGEWARLQEERAQWCGVGWAGVGAAWQKWRVRREGGEGRGRGGGFSSGSRGEHCLRLGRDERGCLCQSLIPPFGK